MEIFINKRFNGPPNSGNGGYVAGLIAKEIGKCCEVKLVAPPPLEKKLLLKKSNENYELYDDETLVCIANTTTVDNDPCEFVSFSDALLGSKNGLSKFEPIHALPDCFVCGPNRKEGDGLRLFTGPQDLDSNPSEDDLVSTTWVPDKGLSSDGKNINSEYLWSAMDCPSGWSAHFGRHRNELEGQLVVLGKLAVEIIRVPRVEEKCIITAKYSDKSGRKILTNISMYSAEQELLANGNATWILIS